MAVGLGMRLWFVRHAPMVAGDSLIYGQIAQHWLRDGVYGFAETNGIAQPTLIRLPGYPLFLVVSFAVFGVGRYLPVQLLQVVVDLLTCVLIALLGGRLFGRKAGWAALWMAACCPFPAMYAGVVLAETWTLFSMALTFVSLERWQARGTGWNPWLVPLTAGLAYGLLLRPEQGLMAAAVVPAMAWMAWRAAGSKRSVLLRLGPVIAVALGTLLPLAPWTLRNWQTFHVVEPLAPKFATDPGEVAPLGFQRWYRTWGVDFASTEDVYWNYDGTRLEVGSLPGRAFDSAKQRAQTAELLADYNVMMNPTPELDARFEALAEERIRGHRVRYYVGLPAARLLDMMFRPRTELLPIETRWWGWRARTDEAVFAAGWAVWSFGYFALGGVGLWMALRKGQGGVVLWAMVGLVILRGCLLLTLDNSETRYTLEFFPVLILGAAALVANWGKDGPGGRTAGPRFAKDTEG